MSSTHTDYEVIGPLPPGSKSRTLLVLQRGGQGLVRHVVFRELERGLVTVPAQVMPGVVPLLDTVLVGGQWYAVYEFCAGVTLGELLGSWLGASRPIPLTLVGRIIFDAATLLHQAHTYRDALDRPVPEVHGSLGEASIQIGFDGVVRLLDFGARRASRFLAPEVVRGDPLDARSDVFSLAAVAHWAVTSYAGGYAAVMARNPNAVEFPSPSHTHPDCSVAFDAALRTGLAPEIADRPETVRAWAAHFERTLGGPMWTTAQVAELVSKRFGERQRELVYALQPRSVPTSAMGQDTFVPATTEMRASAPVARPTAEMRSPPAASTSSPTPFDRPYSGPKPLVESDIFSREIRIPLSGEHDVADAPTHLHNAARGTPSAPRNNPLAETLGGPEAPTGKLAFPPGGRSLLKVALVGLGALCAAVLGGWWWLAGGDAKARAPLVASIGTAAASPVEVAEEEDAAEEPEPIVDAGAASLVVDAGMAPRDELHDAGVARVAAAPVGTIDAGTVVKKAVPQKAVAQKKKQKKRKR